MKLICAVTTLFAVVNYAIAGMCVRKETESCMKAMMQTMEDEQPDAICRASKDIKDCNLRTIEKCSNDPGIRILQSSMDKLDEVIENACSPDKPDVDTDDETLTDDEKKLSQCLADETKLSSQISKCSRQIVKEAKESSHTNNRDDLKCKLLVSYSRCMAQEIANSCDESLEEMLFHQILLEIKRQDRNPPSSSICFNAMKEAEEYFEKNSRKRRSLSAFSFAKFMP